MLRASIAKECPDSEIWLKKLILIKPDAMKIARAQDCGDYIYVGMHTEVKDLSMFMMNIVKKGYGQPVYYTFNDAPKTENSLHIFLEVTY